MVDSKKMNTIKEIPNDVRMTSAIFIRNFSLPLVFIVGFFTKFLFIVELLLY